MCLCLPYLFRDMVEHQLWHCGERLVLKLVHMRGGHRISRGLGADLAKFGGAVHPKVKRLPCQGFRITERKLLDCDVSYEGTS